MQRECGAGYAAYSNELPKLPGESRRINPTPPAGRLDLDVGSEWNINARRPDHGSRRSWFDRQANCNE